MILVTGATGFIGSYLLCHLAEKNIYPVALFRSDTKKNSIQSIFESKFSDGKSQFEKIVWRKGDLTDFPSLEEAFQGITKVYHCAALISFSHSKIKKLIEINEQGTSYIVNLCLSHKVKKLIYVSSIAALGKEETSAEVDEETPWNNNDEKTPYSYSKYGAETEVWRAGQEGLEFCIVNPGVILGKGSPANFILNKIKKGFRFYTPGNTGYVHVSDVISVMSQLMESEVNGERFILVAENWTNKSLYQFLLKKNKKNERVYLIPKFTFYFLWIVEHSLELIFFRKRKLTRSLIKGMYEQKNIKGDKIKTKLDFAYTPIEEVL